MTFEELKADLRETYQNLEIQYDDGMGGRGDGDDYISGTRLAHFIWDTLGKINGQDSLPIPPPQYESYSHWSGTEGLVLESEED